MSGKYPEHVLKYRVPLSYIDPGQVVYNARYLDIYNYARDEYMRDIDYPYIKLNRENQMHLAVAEANIKYRLPLFYDDEVDIVTIIEEIGTKSIRVSHRIYKDNKKTLCNEARFILVAIGPSLKAEALPDNLKKAIIKGP